MKPVEVMFGKEARQKILDGVDILADAVAATMGAKGRNVAVWREDGRHKVTKDGVSVANEIAFEDRYMDIGAGLVKQAARKTNKKAGDGTTTATVLARAMMGAGMEHLASGANPIAIKRGMDKAVEMCLEHLNDIKIDVTSPEQYESIAKISSQDDEVGEIVAKMIDDVGKDGVVAVEPGFSLKMETEKVDGLQFDKGMAVPYFATDQENMTCDIEKAAILVTDAKVDSVTAIIPLVEALKNKGHKDIVFIAEGFSDEIIAVLVVNKVKGLLNAVCVKAPMYGEKKKEILNDIAAVTGATVITKDTGRTIESAALDDLGSAERVSITMETTTIIDGGGDKEDIKKRVEKINAELEKNDANKEAHLKERKAKLTGGIAIIKVGGATEVETTEKIDRVEDALNAVRAAADEGIVAGGGVAYLCCSNMLKDMSSKNADETIGMQIVQEALVSCTEQILMNCGEENVEGFLTDILEHGNIHYGYNALTRNIENLVEAQVIDPKKVARHALENAVSVAGIFLTLEAAIIEVPDTKEEDLDEVL